MVFHESKPGPQAFHLLFGCGDPLPEHQVFPLENPDALAGLLPVGAGAEGALSAAVGHLLLRLEASRPPREELLLGCGEESFQLVERGPVRPCVG